MAKVRERRGEAAIIGLDPFDELLRVGLIRKRNFDRARGPAKAVAEDRYVSLLLALMPYCKPKLNSVKATVQGQLDIVVQVGGFEDADG